MSLRKDKIVNVVMALIVFCVGVLMVIEHQELQITEYCIDNPNGIIEGEIYVNCSEWLKDHPELVRECIAIEKEIAVGE